MLTTLYASVCGVDNIEVKSIDFLSTVRALIKPTPTFQTTDRDGLLERECN